MPIGKKSCVDGWWVVKKQNNFTILNDKNFRRKKMVLRMITEMQNLVMNFAKLILLFVIVFFF
jgi:hypothetical protein